MRVLSVLDRYLVQLKADGRSPFWQSQIERHVRFLDWWLGEHRLPREVRRLHHEHVARFLASPEANTRRDGRLKKTTSTNCLRSSIKVYFGYVHAAGHSPRNAAALVRRARCASPPPRALPRADCKRLLATLAKATGPRAKRDYLLFRMLLQMGLRIGSALAIQVQDVDLRTGELTLTTMKNNRPDRVAIPKSLRPQLRAALAGRTEGPLFEGRAGQPLCGRQARKRLEHWLQRAAARRAGPHSLRHAFAMDVYRRSGDLAVVQAALRHRSIASTTVYARIDDRRARRPQALCTG